MGADLFHLSEILSAVTSSSLPRREKAEGRRDRPAHLFHSRADRLGRAPALAAPGPRVLGKSDAWAEAGARRGRGASLWR